MKAVNWQFVSFSISKNNSNNSNNNSQQQQQQQLTTTATTTAATATATRTRTTTETETAAAAAAADFFPECLAKGSRLSLEVWRLESCSPSIVSTTATVRSGVAKPHSPLGGAHKVWSGWCADMCWRSIFLANSVFLLRFVTCVEVAFAFCVAGAIYLPSVSIVASRFSWQVQFCGRCSILWRGEGGVLMNRNVRAAQTSHSVKGRGRDSILWVPWKTCGTSSIFSFKVRGSLARNAFFSCYFYCCWCCWYFCYYHYYYLLLSLLLLLVSLLLILLLTFL